MRGPTIFLIIVANYSFDAFCGSRWSFALDHMYLVMVHIRLALSVYMYIYVVLDLHTYDRHMILFQPQRMFTSPFTIDFFFYSLILRMEILFQYVRSRRRRRKKILSALVGFFFHLSRLLVLHILWTCITSNFPPHNLLNGSFNKREFFELLEINCLLVCFIMCLCVCVCLNYIM